MINIIITILLAVLLYFSIKHLYEMVKLIRNPDGTVKDAVGHATLAIIYTIYSIGWAILSKIL